MARAVLDASALLALLLDEAGARSVAEVISDSLISPVNQAEVVTKLIERGMPPDVAAGIVSAMKCAPAPVDTGQGLRAGQIHAKTRGGNISLGDRFCLALAEAERLPVLTADKAWAALDLDVEVVLIR